MKNPTLEGYLSRSFARASNLMTKGQVRDNEGTAEDIRAAGLHTVRQIAREINHDADDLIDWYRDDLEDIAGMEYRHVKQMTEDYVTRINTYRRLT